MSVGPDENGNRSTREPGKRSSRFSRIGLIVIGVIALLFALRAGEKILVALTEYFKQ